MLGCVSKTPAQFWIELQVNLDSAHTLLQARNGSLQWKLFLLHSKGVWFLSITCFYEIKINGGNVYRQPVHTWRNTDECLTNKYEGELVCLATTPFVPFVSLTADIFTL